MKKNDNFIMKPKVDYCFKELMKNEIVRKGFISALLKVKPESIEDTKLLPTIQEKESSDGKYKKRRRIQENKKMYTSKYTGF